MTTLAILIVDDDPAFRSLVATQLEAAGYDVAQAGTARAAEAAIATRPPDLVIVDGLLPDRDGEAWIASMRAAGHTRMQVVFVSAFAAYARDMKTFHRLTKELAVDLVLSKPIAPDKLLAALDGLLAVKPTARFTPAVKLDLLRAAYRGELADKLGAIDAELAAARRSGDRQAAAGLVHRLHGTAGSYGFGDVSAAAGRISELLEPELETPDWRAIAAALDALRAAIVRAQTERG